MRVNKESVFYSTFILALSNMTLQILGFLYRIMLSRLLGSTGMGVFQLVFPAVSVVMSLSLSGLTLAVSKLAAEAYAVGDYHAIRKLVGKCQITFSFLLVVITLPLWIFSNQIATSLLGDNRVAAALMIAPFYILLTGIENLYKSCFYGIRKVSTIVVSELSELLIRIASVAALLFIFKNEDPGRSAALIMVGMVLSEIFSATFLSFAYRKRVPDTEGTLVSAKYKINMSIILQIAIPIALAGLLNNLIGSANAVLLPKGLVLSGMTSEQAIQSFGVLVGMVIPLFMLPFGFIGSLSSIILPKLAEGIALANQSDIKRKTAKAIHATSLLAMPCIAVLIPLAPALCRLLYHQEIPSGYILPLAIGSLLNYYRAITSTVLHGLGIQKQASVIAVGGELIHLMITIFFVRMPGIGVYGYLAGFVFCSALELLFNLGFVLAKTKIRIMWINWFIQPGLTAALAGFAARFTYLGTSHLMSNDSVRVVVSIFAAILFYSALLSVQGVRLSTYIKRISQNTARKITA